MTNEHLAALSDVATQGLCFAQAPDTEHDYGVPIVATDDLAAPMPTNGMVLWATMQPTEIDALDTVQAEANAAFVVALWNAYRANQLAVIGPDAVELAARAMQDMPYMADWDDLELEDCEHMREMARLAIAALTGRA